MASLSIVVVLSTLFFIFEIKAEETYRLPKTIVMVTGLNEETSVTGRWLSLVYTEAFGRLGITLIYKTYPLKRCSLLSDSGDVDGDLWRNPTYGEVHPNLIRVEGQGPSAAFIAYATNPNIKELNGWESLIGTEYRVDYLRGTKRMDELLPDLINNEQIDIVNKIEHGLTKLTLGRTDIFLGNELMVNEMLKTDAFKNLGIHQVGVIERVFSHAFLHKKHKDLEPELSAILIKMREEGLFDTFKKMALKNQSPSK